jgi:hypothetical protein
MHFIHAFLSSDEGGGEELGFIGFPLSQPGLQQSLLFWQRDPAYKNSSLCNEVSFLFLTLDFRGNCF